MKQLVNRYCSFNVSSKMIVAGRCWIDALELTMKCSKLLKRPYSTSIQSDDLTINSPVFSNFSTTTIDGSFLNASLSDNDLDLSRSTAKEGSSFFQ